MGASGFRVDMAESLVKRDSGYKETIRLWNNIRDWMQKAWPDSILISEWSFPEASIKSGFQIDFVLPMMFRGLPQMIFNESGTYAVGNCYFDKKEKGDAQLFIQHFISQYKKTKGKGIICLPTANHDYQRPHCGSRNSWDELKAIMLFNLTWSDLPMIYYGDEIGMRYLEGLINKEGSAMNRYINRAGERTPMQWERSETAGFSDANPNDFYLPIDDFNRQDFPNLEEQKDDDNSQLNFVKKIIEIRKSHQAFSRFGNLNIIFGYDYKQYPLAYTRIHEDEIFLVVINPCDETKYFQLKINSVNLKDYELESLINKGININETHEVRCEGISYALFNLKANN